MDKGLTPLEILEVSKIVAAAMVVDKGDFAKELEALRKEKAELERVYGVLPDVKAAREARNAAEGILVAEKAKAEEHTKKLAAELQKVRDQQRELQAAKAAAENERLEAVSKQRALDQAAREMNEAHAKRVMDLAVRETELSAGEVRLAADRKRLDEKVKQIKATAVA